MTYTIKKQTSGYGRYYVYRDDVFFRKTETMKDAKMLIALLEGDRSVAPEWYRRQLKSARKRMSESDAIRFAMGSAQLMNLSPTAVRADPDTGKPL